MQENKEYFILTINPGSTSTKIGIFKNDELQFSKNIYHNDQDLVNFKRVWDQYAFRKKTIVDVVRKEGFEIQQLSCVVGRGGLFKPIISGTYSINKEMLDDARNAVQGEHASNLGCVLAFGIGWDYDIPAYIVDPPCVDEMEDIARISGHISVKRTSLVHALNIKAIARIAAAELNKPLSQLNLIIAHLGGGASVTPLRQGRMIDTSDAINAGPFTPERSGTIPITSFIEYIFKKNIPLSEIKKMLVGQGGMYSYLKTKSMIDLDKGYEQGDPKFQLIMQAMAYQVGKEIGAMAAALSGKIDAIVLTGGAARSKILVNLITERVEFLSKILVYPGEDELKALAQGALRVLRGEEKPFAYPQQIEYKDWFPAET